MGLSARPGQSGLGDGCVAGARKHKAQVIASVVLFKSRSTAAVYAQVDRRLTVTVKVEVCHWRSAVLGNNKNNKNPFSLPRAGTTTFPSLKIKPSSQVTKWGARSERVNRKNKHPHRQLINPPSLSPSAL